MSSTNYLDAKRSSLFLFSSFAFRYLSCKSFRALVDTIRLTYIGTQGPVLGHHVNESFS